KYPPLAPMATSGDVDKSLNFVPSAGTPSALPVPSLLVRPCGITAPTSNAVYHSATAGVPRANMAVVKIPPTEMSHQKFRTFMDICETGLFCVPRFRLPLRLCGTINRNGGNV